MEMQINRDLPHPFPIPRVKKCAPRPHRLGYVWVDASRLSISRKIGNESEQVELAGARTRALTVTITRYVQPRNKGKPNYNSDLFGRNSAR